jgi:hypothetical protein
MSTYSAGLPINAGLEAKLQSRNTAKAYTTLRLQEKQSQASISSTEIDGLDMVEGKADNNNRRQRHRPGGNCDGK